MTSILVTGGTGHLGRDLVPVLLARGHSVRLLARSQPAEPRAHWVAGDLATGVGISKAVEGIDAVIHAATLSPIARRGGVRPIDFFTSPSGVDVDGTRRLLEASRQAGVRHFLFVSIVGLEDSSLPYSRIKLAAEHLVRNAQTPWSVVRAAPFFYLTANLLEGLRWWPIWPLPEVPCDPVDTADVAVYLAECVADGPRGVREEIGGPETMSFTELARQFQRARGIKRRIVPMRTSERRARKLGLVVSSGHRGRKTWSAWLEEQRGLPG